MTLAPSQTSVHLGPNQSLWLESMQDMSGFVTPDTISPQLDEHLAISNSTAQFENDFYVQKPGLEEFCWGYISERVTDDSDMFDNSNYGTLDSKTNECQTESPIKQGLYDMHSDNIRTTMNMGDVERNFPSQKILFCLPKAKLVSTVKKEKQRFLEIIDSEEPLIKEDPDLLYCTQNKMDIDRKANVDVSELLVKEDPQLLYCPQNKMDIDIKANVDVSELLVKEDPHLLYCPQNKIDIDIKANVDVSELLVKKDPHLLYCPQNKMDFDVKAELDVSKTSSKEDMVYCSTDFKDMGVAEEVIVTTEEEDECKTNLNVSLFDCVSLDSEEELNIPEETEKKDLGVSFKADPFSGIEDVFDKWFIDLDQMGDELYSHLEENFDVSPEAAETDDLARHSMSPLNDLFSSNAISEASNKLNRTTDQELPLDEPTKVTLFSGSTDCQTSSKPAPKHVPLTLDIDAARAALLVDKGVSDTPELLEALKPEVGKFDLIKFITSNGDPNNNAISPIVETHPKKPEVPRKGKSHLSLSKLKQAQKQSRGKPMLKAEDKQIEIESFPSTSKTSPTGRPARQSATRFKRMIEEGLLSSVVDSQSVSSEEEEDAPKAKRCRTTSTTSSRRRHNSDSDQSSVSEDAMKYRERRDRNNLSSKRSRQKRKVQRLMKQEELRELEKENARLRLKAEELNLVLTRVKAAWADYLAHMSDNDKDRGDEQ